MNSESNKGMRSWNESPSRLDRRYEDVLLTVVDMDRPRRNPLAWSRSK